MKLRSWALPKPRRTDEGEGFGQAIELASAVTLFALAGAALDAWLGTRPTLTIVGIVFAAVGGFSSAYYRYQARVRSQDAGKPWTRKAARDAARGVR